MQDMKEFLGLVAIAICAYILFAGVVITPLLYADGKVKASILEKRGEHVPWYTAAFMPDSYFTNANVTLKAAE